MRLWLLLKIKDAQRVVLAGYGTNKIDNDNATEFIRWDVCSR